MQRALSSVAVVAAIVLCSPTGATAAGPETGPVVEGFGPVYAAPEGAVGLDTGRTHRVSMDVAAAPEDPAVRNRSIESAARFLNMNARQGIASRDIEFALVLHGRAARAALSEAAYRERYGMSNPDGALMTALVASGVRFFLCWQSAAHAGFSAREINPEVTIAVSAMNAHVNLQQQGYALIPF